MKPVSRVIPVHLRFTLVWLAAVFMGCAHTQGYDGAERDRAEIAVVVAGFDIIEGTMRAAVVSIETIDGADELGRWRRGNARVELLPGTYDLVFSVDWGSSPFGARRAQEQGRTRLARMRVEAGHSYHVTYDYDGHYFLMRSAPDGDDAQIVFPAPGSRERCRLALTSRDVARCETTLDRG